MLSFLPPARARCPCRAAAGLNTLFWCTLLFALSLVKLVLPARAVRVRIDPWLNTIATLWIACNSGWMRLTQRTAWDVQGVDELRYAGWYLVNSNHQTWADIFVLQHVLNRRIPMLKFFLKQQLIYVPVIGLAWWALDFPFMKRHSAAQLERHPELRQQDRLTTMRACEKFALVPTCVMNFAEGTRFTRAKHAGAGLAPPPPAQAQGRCAGAGAERDGRKIPLAGRRDHRLPGGRAGLLAVPVRRYAAHRGACAAAAHTDRVLCRRLCRGRRLPRALPALADALWEDKDAQIDALLR